MMVRFWFGAGLFRLKLIYLPRFTPLSSTIIINCKILTGRVPNSNVPSRYVIVPNHQFCASCLVLIVVVNTYDEGLCCEFLLKLIFHSSDGHGLGLVREENSNQSAAAAAT